MGSRRTHHFCQVSLSNVFNSLKSAFTLLSVLQYGFSIAHYNIRCITFDSLHMSGFTCQSSLQVCHALNHSCYCARPLYAMHGSTCLINAVQWLPQQCNVDKVTAYYPNWAAGNGCAHVCVPAIITCTPSALYCAQLRRAAKYSTSGADCNR